ncbi:MAG: hypothetical protein KJ057_02270 [Phycisphaerae bacterium]|nr:MAG: hypothetical protein EDS66_03065 [Planctomycetota bacterium]KAB2948962.1 MAG: hypothetical protein F9K17_04760 [Phycisphaerae bacterium]MBE7456018.1 hypothetical protein [Planctomycetia bacterium]MCK6465145.1 hypothetical protein [Phycisphaerae bacterium]MCL4717276.1 hypothetical protein [Phycisphaerae bacterium]
MTSLKERVEARLREDVCKACVFRTAAGECSLEGVRDCPILTRVDKIIEIVRGIDSPDVAPYAQALREAVCANCEHQHPDGTCRLRDRLDCALDDYFAWIVNIVDEELAATE